MHKKITNITILLLILSINLNASDLKEVNIDPLNRATFYFDSYPIDFNLKINEDKKTATLGFSDARAVVKNNELTSTGIIRTINIKSLGDRLEAIIELSDKRGWTVVNMPFSMTIQLEVFVWEDLSVAEDNYRMGLLALQDNIYKAAVESFQKASDMGHSLSKMHLGMLMLYQNEYEKALTLLLDAEMNLKDNADLYGALALTYENMGDKVKSREYSDKFQDMSGNHLNTELPVIVISEDSSEFENLSQLKMLGRDLPQIEDSTKKDDTSDSRFNDIFADDDTTKQDSTKANAEGSIISYFTSIIIAGVAAILLLFVYFYLKWRKKQLEAKKRQQVKKFTKTLKAAEANVNVNKRHASNVYSQQQKMADKSKDSDKDESKEKEAPIMPEVTKKKPLSEEKLKKKIADKQKREVMALIDAVKSKIRDDEPSSKYDDKTTPIINKSKSESKPTTVSAKSEMAQHLAQQQYKLKKQNLENMKQKGIPTDISKLDEVAKKFRLEKGGLEARRSLEDIEKDEKRMQELQKKFSINKDDKEDNPDT